MREPSLRTSRLAIAGGLLAAAALVGAGFLVGRTTLPDPPAPIAAPQPPVSPPPPPLIETPGVLGRADLIALGNRVADGLTTGDAASLPGEAVGRRVELILPFGCDGPAQSDSRAPLRWHYDAERQRLQVHVSPVRWDLDEWDIEGHAAPARLEGYWISRPWSSGERCPRGSAQSAGSIDQPATLPGQTLAVAQLIEGEEREAREFDIVKRVPPESFAPNEGFRLRLTGRLGQLPGGKSTRCVQPAGTEQRPICLIRLELDEVRIENTASGEVLGSWDMRPRERKQVP